MSNSSEIYHRGYGGVIIGVLECIVWPASGSRKDSVGEILRIRKIISRGRTGSTASSDNRLINAEVIRGITVSMFVLEVTLAYSSDNFPTC